MTQLTFDILTIFAEAQAPETLRALHVESDVLARRRAAENERSTRSYAWMRAQGGERYERKLARARARHHATYVPKRSIPKWKRRYLAARNG